MTKRIFPLIVPAWFALTTSPALAQWDVFEDPQVESQCGLVNVATLEFAVRSCDGALVLVTGDDVGFANTVVRDDWTVEIDGDFAGFISFEQDADGFFTLWWLSDAGFVIDFNDVTSEPFETDRLPIDFENVPCDAGDFWTDEGDCDAESGDEEMLPVDFVDDDDEIACGPIALSVFLFSLVGLVLMLGHQKHSAPSNRSSE